MHQQQIITIVSLNEKKFIKKNLNHTGRSTIGVGDIPESFKKHFPKNIELKNLPQFKSIFKEKNFEPYLLQVKQRFLKAHVISIGCL